MNKNILALFAIGTMSALNTQAQVSLSLRAGVGFQNINGKDAQGNTLNNDVVMRYHAGVLVNIPVAPDFFVQTGLLYTTKGTKITETYLGNERTRTVHLNYVELPISFTYRPLLGNGHLILGFGPYVSYGLGGKIVTSGGVPDQKVVWKNKVNTSDGGQSYFKPMESGANFFFGYEFFNHLEVQFNAQLGLTKINPTDSRITNDKTIMKNTGFGLSLGWRF